MPEIERNNIKKYDDLLIEAHTALGNARQMLTANAVNVETYKRFVKCFDELNELVLDAHKLTHPM